jgi:hypothetical protein
MSPECRAQILAYHERQWRADMLSEMWHERDLKARRLGFGPLASNGPTRPPQALPVPSRSVMSLLLD